MDSQTVQNAVPVTPARQQLRHSVELGYTAAPELRVVPHVRLATNVLQRRRHPRVNVWQAITHLRDQPHVRVVIRDTSVRQTAWKYRTHVQWGRFQNLVEQLHVQIAQ